VIDGFKSLRAVPENVRDSLSFRRKKPGNITKGADWRSIRVVVVNPAVYTQGVYTQCNLNKKVRMSEP
jgi:hypothetical protein